MYSLFYVTEMDVLIKKVENMSFDIKKIKNFLQQSAQEKQTVDTTTTNFPLENNLILPFGTENDYENFNSQLLENAEFRSDFVSFSYYSK